MGKRPAARQASPMWVDTADLPTNDGHPYFERLNRVLENCGFDAFVEELCATFYADRLGRPSLRPGRYFRMLFIGYFEGLTPLYVKNARGSTTARSVRGELKALASLGSRSPRTVNHGRQPAERVLRCAPALRVTAAADRAGSPCAPAGRLALDPLPGSATPASHSVVAEEPSTNSRMGPRSPSRPRLRRGADDPKARGGHPRLPRHADDGTGPRSDAPCAPDWMIAGEFADDLHAARHRFPVRY